MHDDPQVSQLYRWEEKIFKQSLTQANRNSESCRDLVQKSWALWFGRDRPPTPTVVITPDNTTAATGFAERICLPPWGMNEIIIAHELSHAVIDVYQKTLGFLVEAHGKEYAWVYSRMLQIVDVMPSWWAARSMRYLGVALAATPPWWDD